MKYALSDGKKNKNRKGKLNAPLFIAIETTLTWENISPGHQLLSPTQWSKHIRLLQDPALF